jgi:acyl-coenzyme A thioesterase PaaI-like protein
MQANTHQALDPRLCGSLRELEAGRALVELRTAPEMAADARGLVHGGFVFGLADAAAMYAINEPHVVLGSAETRFLAPVVVGETLRAEARFLRREGKKHHVQVRVTRVAEARGQGTEAPAGSHAPVPVFEGTFVCFVPAQHVLGGGA